jgi:hypothetical protein
LPKKHACVAVQNDYSKGENQINDKSFLFSSYISPNKQVSFKSANIYDPSASWICHLDGIVERAGVMINGSYEKFDELWCCF